MLVSDAPPEAVLLNDSQDVHFILQNLECEEDYGGIFLFDGKAWGFYGVIPYLKNELFEIGPWEN